MQILKDCVLALIIGLPAVAVAGVYNDNSIWTKRDISVCIINDENISEAKSDLRLNLSPSETKRLKNSVVSPSLKTDMAVSIIKKTIQKEYTRERTGIHFYGFEPCELNSGGPKKSRINADFALIIVDVVGKSPITGVAFLSGSNLDYDKEKKNKIPLIKTVAFFVGDELGLDEKIATQSMDGVERKLSNSDTLRLASIHEFGHVAGLFHEQDFYAESTKDDNCKTTKIIKAGDEKETALLNREYAEAFKVTKTGYDNSSVMNYCLIFFVIKQGKSFLINSDTLQDLSDNGISGDFSNPNAGLASSKFTLRDSTVFTKTELGQGESLVRMNIGLSQGDVRTLKKIYK